MTKTPTTPEAPEETNRDRFVRVVNRRAGHVLTDIDILSKMAGKPYYEYSEADIDAVFARMEDALKAARRKFSPEAQPDPRQFNLLDATKKQEAA